MMRFMQRGTLTTRTALVALGLGLSGCGTLDTVGGWVGMGGSAKIKPAELVDFKPALSLTRVWDATVGAPGVFVFAPALADGTVYAAAADGQVLSLDVATGQPRWRVTLAHKLSAGAAAGEGLVVVGTPKGQIVALRAADGAIAWTAQVSGEILARPLVQGGAVFARGSDGRVYKLDAKDGKTLWAYSRTLPSLTLREAGGLVADADAVYAGHPGGRLTALSQTNGAPLWEVNVALPRGATEMERIADVLGTPAVEGRLVCAAAYQGRVACFDRATGNPVWAREFAASRGVDLDDRSVYAVDAESVIQAFERQRGVSPWKQDKLRHRQLGTPLALGEQVVVSDYQGYLHVLNRLDGALLARVATDGNPVRGELLALRQGFVVQTANGHISAFKLDK
jgi:outer membrane protein assembly factor BamB